MPLFNTEATRHAFEIYTLRRSGGRIRIGTWELPFNLKHVPRMYPSRCMLFLFHVWSITKYIALFMTFRYWRAFVVFSREKFTSDAAKIVMTLALIFSSHAISLNYCVLEKIKGGPRYLFKIKRRWVLKKTKERKKITK